MKICLREQSLPVIWTKRLVIRDIQIADISDEYINWLNDPEIVKYLEIRFAKQTRQTVEDFVKNKLLDQQNSMHFGVYDSDGKRLVGTVTLPNINNYHLSSDISFVVGHPKAQGLGYASEAVHGVVYYLFEVLKFKKIWAGYYDGHKASANVLRKNGFIEEGRLKNKLINYAGERVDHVLVGIQSHEFDPNADWLDDLPPIFK